MKTTIIIAVAAFVIATPCTYARADHDGAHVAPAATLLYLDRSGWEQASGEAKLALAADFMRVFCGNPAMPVADLVNCLDRSKDASSVFTRAMTCLATVPTNR
jgi:hypothetical protein